MSSVNEESDMNFQRHIDVGPYDARQMPNDLLRNPRCVPTEPKADGRPIRVAATTTGGANWEFSTLYEGEVCP